MRKPETVTMTMRELDRLKVIQAVVEHSLPIWRAAEKLGLSRRQIERLSLRYREDGPGFLGAPQAAPAQGPPATQPPGLPGRVGADRR